ncbi:MAG: hypothetical protein L3J11_07870 [Draconibacterium sp.]|nr:hypothetical protein [Draconibacterium sp.]
MNVKGKYITIILLVLIVSKMQGQTCCSGGTPLTGNLGIQGIEAKSWYFQLGYDYNFLDNLYSGTKKLDDNSRERLTQTVLLQSIYSFSEKFSVNGLFSYVEQKRTIHSPIGITNITQASGLGDVVLLAQYTLFSGLKRSLTIAAGPKLPIGKFDAVDPEYGLVLSPDLQPGTGSLDGIVGAAFQEYHLFHVPGLTFNASAAFRKTRPAKRFEADFKYRFGNETMFAAGIQRNFLIHKIAINPSLFLNFRNTQQDKIDDLQVAGTGGIWLNLNPAVSLAPNNILDINISGEIPIYQNLNGTQLTTSYRINVGIAIKLFNYKN